jgi:hypothetical protein
MASMAVILQSPVLLIRWLTLPHLPVLSFFGFGSPAASSQPASSLGLTLSTDGRGHALP